MSNKEIKVKSLPLEIKEDGVYIIDQPNPNRYTHGFFKYPCKFIPEIPRWAISKFTNEIEDPIIYDPFSGSGTTLVEAALKGYQSYGSEIDDTAKLVTRVKTTRLSNEQLDNLDTIIEQLIQKMDSPKSKYSIAEITNIEHWFPANTIQHLGRLKYAISQIKDSAIRDFFYVCFASIIKKVSFADDVSPKPYVSSKVVKNPPPVENEFRNIFKRYKEGILRYSEIEGTISPIILKGGALGLDEISKFDLAITSPPYINAFDYARSMRLENLWLSYASEDSIRKSKKDYVGTESIKQHKDFTDKDFLADSTLLQSYLEKILPIDAKRAEIVNKFFIDMKLNMELVYKALKPNGVYTIVIGNSSIRKVNIESWKVLKEIGLSIGYKYLTHFSYKIQNPYIRIPREGQGGNINIDHIIILNK